MSTDSLRSGNPSRDPRAGAPTGAPVPRFPIWPLFLLALPAFVAIWSGWVGLGGLCGFGIMHPLPGIADRVRLNTAITLPVGMETYAAYALRAWLSPGVPVAARRFAKWSACMALAVGATGQVAYHLMAAARWTSAPWPVTILVSCVPVAVLGMGVALAHLIRMSPIGDTTAAVSAIADTITGPMGPEIRSAKLAERDPSAFLADVEAAFGPLPEAPVSPARPPKSPAEWVAEDDALKAERPELNAEQRAELLGVSSRHIRNCRKQVTR